MVAKIGRPAKDDADKKKRESIYFDPEVSLWLQKQSVEQGTAVSSIVNSIVKRHMKEKERT